MSHVKTAISLQPALLEQAEALARKMKIPRSRLIALALEDYLRRHENQNLLERINAAYEEGRTPDEQVYLRRTRRMHRSVVDGEW